MSHSKNSNRSPADILMYSHRSSGGATTASNGGSMPPNEPHFSGGGSGRPKSYMRNGRSCHAEGDTVGVNPVNGYKYPGSPENKRKGGRARHAEGDTVEAVPYKRGGRSHKKREHHGWGDSVKNSDQVPFYNMSMPKNYQVPSYNMPRSKGCFAEGGKTSEDNMEQKKRGGVARNRRREHHNFGQTIGNIASAVLPFLSFLKNGGQANRRRRHHEQGDEVPLKRAMGGAGKVRKGMMGGDGSLA